MKLGTLRAVAAVLTLMALSTVMAAPFVVRPYLQNPAHDAMTLIWFSAEESPGRVTYAPDEGSEDTLESEPTLATALGYHPAEVADLAQDARQSAPYKHRVRLEGLEPDTRYTYTVTQGSGEHRSSFRTPPDVNTPLRFIVYSDSETEPESSDEQVGWTDPEGGDDERVYLVNQTVGYRENLRVMAQREPAFVVIAGDLVESGGEQRDWDEFWRHNAGELGMLASRVPLLPALGNHENYGGPGDFGGYSIPAAVAATEKYRSYFEAPENGAPVPEHEGRYYRTDYGPVTIITLDSSNGRLNGTAVDTNFFLASDTEGGIAPDFNPGSPQYAWLEAQLTGARERSKFVFVQFHHTPYSVGPHGLEPGAGEGFDTQSGVPLRVLTPLFMEHRVDAVFSGHDEMFERSVLEQEFEGEDGETTTHAIHFYDVGVGGDGLRGPVEGLENPHQAWLAHSDAPEVYEDVLLTDGGKHYGHLEVEVTQDEQERWQATLTPVYVFPVTTRNDAGEVQVERFERRVHDDVVTLMSTSE